jgi:hypothetical protein
MKLLSTLVCPVLLVYASRNAQAELRAGAAIADVTPAKYPVLVNGGMTSRSADGAYTPISARAIVLDDGRERIGVVVVDSCMMTRDVLDEAKQQAAQRTQLAADRILISATHAHSVPSSMGCLGTDADPEYIPVLRAGIVQALVKAEANLEPARVGWGVTQAPDFTAVRRWIRRPDRIGLDPFGNPTVRATMHAGSNWDEAIGESGPEDPDLTLLAIQSAQGRPIAVLANFSMHYFSGVKALDADYFGRFCDKLAKQVTSQSDPSTPATASDAGEAPAFVGIMSHGCSGDIWRRDYTQPAEAQLPHDDIEEFAGGLAALAFEAYQSIQYDANADLAMAATRLPLKYRVPDEQRLQWARHVMEELGEGPPKDTREVYAREQVLLHELQSTEVVLQAIRIGSLAIASTPNETYALTGMKIKLQSPLSQTMVIELANGGDGYIPPPEQHLLGGYNTWPARSAGLEVQAEPKIVASALALLEVVSGKPRQQHRQTRGSAAEATLGMKPLAYWRLDEMSGPWANDASGNDRHAVYELPVAFFLEGPRSELFTADGEVNRSVHIVDGRICTPLRDLSENSSVSLWCWNGMPVDARAVTGWMLSHGESYVAGGISLGLGGTASEPGKLILRDGDETHAGTTAIERWSWNHIVLVRDGDMCRVHLNGNSTPEIALPLPAALASMGELTFGGLGEHDSNWEGRLDEIAVFERALSSEEILRLAGNPE